MNPCSCIRRMPSSLVAPQTPACVVTGMPSSRAASNAAFSGKAGSPVTSKAICTPIRSSPASRSRSTGTSGWPGRRSTPTVRPGCCRRRGRTGRAPNAARPRAASPWSRLDSPCDQSTVVVTPASRDSMAASRLPAAMSCGRNFSPVLQVVPDEVLGQRPVGAVPAHRRLPHVPVGVDHARHHDAAAGVDLLCALGHLEVRTDRRDAVTDHQHVGVRQDRRRRIHRQHGAAAEAPWGGRRTGTRSGCVIVAPGRRRLGSDGRPQSGHPVRGDTFDLAAKACQGFPAALLRGRVDSAAEASQDCASPGGRTRVRWVTPWREGTSCR